MHISENVSKRDSPRSTSIVCTRPWLAWLTSPRLRLANLTSPIRGEASQACQGQPSKPSQRLKIFRGTATGPSRKHGFGPDWVSRGSKSNFDWLPRQGIASRSCWRGWFDPGWTKMDRNIWGSGRVGSSFGRIFRTFSKMVRESLRPLFEGLGRPGRLFWDFSF